MHVRNAIKMAADKVTQGRPGPRGAEVEVEGFVLSLMPVLGAVHGDGHETSAGGASTQLGGTSTTQGRAGPQEAGGTGVARRRPEHRRAQLAPSSHPECFQQGQGPARRSRGGGREGLERKGGGS